MKKKFISLLLSVILITQPIFSISALTDNFIFSDPIENTYQGRSEAADIIYNISFTDVPADHPARESIAQGGALNLIKGYERQFSPNEVVSKQEALAFLIRAIGRENEAIALGAALQASAPAGSTLSNLWSLGYLNIAYQLELISLDEYNDATAEDQTMLDPTLSFMRESPVSRQQMAAWLYGAISSADPSAFDTTRTTQSLFAYNDWQSVDADKAIAVEAVLSNNIMTGTGGRFNPNGTLTKAEVAQILKNMDSIYFAAMNIERVRGTVGGVRNYQYTETGYAGVWRNFYIRRADSKVDVIQYPMEVSSSPQDIYKDVVVYKNGSITGMIDLKEGDIVEYLVDTFRNEVLYILVTGETTKQEVSGTLQSLDFTNRSVTITDASGKTFTYPISQGLLYTENGKNYIYFDRVGRDISTLPYGSRYTLTIINNIITDMKYLGDPVIINEISGIVTENNPDYGYMTIAQSNGQVVTYQYYENDMVVSKRQYYESADTVGYISQIFPHYGYNPQLSNITDIEPGDIVFLTFDAKNPKLITAISAATDYVVKYGKIRQITTGASSWQVLVEYENKQTSWFTISDTVFVSADGRPSTFGAAKSGDWIKLLVNQAIITPGYIIESVKEIVIEGDEHFISTIVKGQLAGIDKIQNQLTLQNVQTLAKTGWSNYKQVQNFSLSGRDVEYYYNNQRITLDYAEKFLKRSLGEVYVALENNFAGERVKKVTFRDGRDEVLTPDTVVASNGAGGFRIISQSGVITTDAGTIVRRYGRLVDGQSIMIPDYATVVLNGGNGAAIVDIVDAPDTSAITVVRGRVRSVNDGQSFTVQSMSMLSGMTWTYSPVQREFTIDYNTLFLNSAGYVDPSTFLSYTSTTVVDKVYTIVVEGSRATRVIEAPYPQRGVRGTVYSIEGDTISLKDVTYYDDNRGTWRPISNSNSIATVTVLPSTVIGKNNTVTQTSALQIGDQLRVMTDALPNIMASGLNVTGYIIFVEK